MSQLGLVLIALFGVVLACALTWIFMRRIGQAAVAQARSDSQVESSRLTDRLATVTRELTDCKARLLQSGTERDQLRDQIDHIRDERSRLEERTNRLSVVEAELLECKPALTSLREEISALTAQLSERNTMLEYLAKRLSDGELEHKTHRQTLETLQTKLQEESNRAATLMQQSTRLPELEKALGESVTENQRLQGLLSAVREKHAASFSTVESQGQQIASLQGENSRLEVQRDELAAALATAKTQLAEAAVALEAERKQAGEKLALLTEAREQLSDQFRSLANEILEEKAKRFTEQNQTNIGLLLTPVKTKLQEFQTKVEEVYIQEGKERAALGEQVRHLLSLNKQLSDDALNLTRALKGSSKAQGNWGELILERILEASGLRKGYEYDVRETHTREDGSRAQPDVIVHLPDSKQLVIDSKVSLNAYNEYANAENDLIRQAAVERHVDSVRGHITQLSSKNYQLLYELKSLDFVVMFVPVEPAFILAIAHDSGLWEAAWKKNVLLVSPSTLLFVVRTVAHLWRQEQQNRNVQDIAKRGAELYDKLTGFVEDLTELGKRLSQAKQSFDSASAKFSTGRGNVIRQAEMLKDLGVKPSKSLPQSLVDSAFDESMALPGVLEADATVLEDEAKPPLLK